MHELQSTVKLPPLLSRIIIIISYIYIYARATIVFPECIPISEPERHFWRNGTAGVFCLLQISIGKANHKRRRRQGKSRLPVLRHWRGIAFCLLDCGLQPDTRTAKEKNGDCCGQGPGGR